MKEILITMNASDSAPTNKELGEGIGKLHLFVLDAKALEQGKIKVLRKAWQTATSRKPSASASTTLRTASTLPTPPATSFS